MVSPKYSSIDIIIDKIQGKNPNTNSIKVFILSANNPGGTSIDEGMDFNIHIPRVPLKT